MGVSCVVNTAGNRVVIVKKCSYGKLAAIAAKYGTNVGVQKATVGLLRNVSISGS